MSVRDAFLRSFLRSHQLQLLQPGTLVLRDEARYQPDPFAVDWPFVATTPAVQWMETVPMCDEDKVKILRQRPSGRSLIVWGGARGLAPAAVGPWPNG